MKRIHDMPFGARYLGDGRTHFRLWAPAAARLTLELQSGAQASTHVPARDAEGWHECIVPAAPGTRYRYRLPDGLAVPDPASRCNPDDVHRASMVIDPSAYDWEDGAWRGRPWHEAVICEVHVGAATDQGTFAALEERLDHYAALGVTALELMPLADFAGRRNWGYDGVLPYAPDASYGTADALKRFIDAAHRRGLMVFIDVVYNHFGPDGNYLALYAPQFFTERHHTPWGAAINYDGAGAAAVREFFIHNALYWLEEFHADGLRLDAVHAIIDDSGRHLLTELADRVREKLGTGRHVHLMLENDDNRASLLARGSDGGPRWYDAQWNDDWHHVFHILLTGEQDGYYRDYAAAPTECLARTLAQGYVAQGEPSIHRGGRPRGEVSAGLPPTAFVSFLQNHDQIGNRAYGDRLTTLADHAALRAAVCGWLLAPQIPLLFMGEEYGLDTPFLFFCDFAGELARAVRDGRRSEFAGFAAFDTPAARDAIPDPDADETYARSKMPWHLTDAPLQQAWYALYAALLRIRHERIVPLLSRIPGHAGEAQVLAPGAVAARWTTHDGLALTVRLNLSRHDVTHLSPPSDDVLHVEPPAARGRCIAGELPAQSAIAFLGPRA